LGSGLEFSGYSALSRRAWRARAASEKKAASSFGPLVGGPRLASKESPTKPNHETIHDTVCFTICLCSSPDFQTNIRTFSLVTSGGTVMKEKHQTNHQSPITNQQSPLVTFSFRKARNLCSSFPTASSFYFSTHHRRSFRRGLMWLHSIMQWQHCFTVCFTIVAVAQPFHDMFVC
jgi:hypothetical protein